MELNDKMIIEHLRQQAYLTKGVRINFFDRRRGVPLFYGFYFEGGVLSFVKFLAQNKTACTRYFLCRKRAADKLDIEVAFLYVDDTRSRRK